MKTKSKETIINPGSERNILSICLKNQNRIVDCEMEGLEPHHFLVPAHQYIYMSIAYLTSRNTKPTPMAIVETMTDKVMQEAIEEIGGISYLMALESAKIHEENLEIFADKIKQSYTRMKLHEMSDKLKLDILNTKAEVLNPTELIAIAEGMIQSIESEVTIKREDYKLGDDTEEVLRERAETPDAVPGLEVGWPKFDRYTQGGQPGDLIMICARSKVGKSALLLNFAVTMAIKDKLPILYIDTEMSSRSQEDRALAMLSGVPESEIVSGMFMLDTDAGKSQDKIDKLNEATEMLQSGYFHYISMPTFTTETVEATVRGYKLKHNIVAVFFDYLKFPANQQNRLNSAQEWQMLGFTASGLKDLATELEIPIYSACQENRIDVEGTNKNASNVGGSDRILQLATKLMFLYNKPSSQLAEDGLHLGNQELYIAYQRNGMSDVEPINIMFDRPYLKMEEI